MNLMRWFFSFHGRVGRRVFLFGTLFICALFSLILFVLVFAIRSVAITPQNPFHILDVPTVIAATSWLSLVVKRLHDLGRSGFWALGVAFAAGPCKWVGYVLFPTNSAFLQLVSWLILALFFATLIMHPGEERDNDFGPRVRNLIQSKPEPV
jgi:uncharacterized membrane protein YhaH (DUF805 family)